jgi:hypothetical protein
VMNSSMASGWSGAAHSWPVAYAFLTTASACA